jgi:hypothetical protein
VSGSVIGAVSGTATLVALAVTLPPVRAFFGLAAPSPRAVGLIGAASAAATGLGRSVGR